LIAYEGLQKEATEMISEDMKNDEKWRNSEEGVLR
jgi:hypothetical protein